MRRAISILFLCAWWDYSHVRAESADVAGGGLCPDIPLMAILIKQKCFLPTYNGLVSIQNYVLNRYSKSYDSIAGTKFNFSAHFFLDSTFKG